MKTYSLNLEVGFLLYMFHLKNTYLATSLTWAWSAHALSLC